VTAGLKGLKRERWLYRPGVKLLSEGLTAELVT